MDIVKRRRINRILKVVSRAFDIPLDELISRRREEEIARARQIIMYFMIYEEDITLQEAGDILGGRTPATIAHGANQIWIRRSIYPDLDKLITKIRNKISEPLIRDSMVGSEMERREYVSV